MRTITLVVHCRPSGKPRMTQRDKWKQRPCVLRYRAFKDEIRKVRGPLIIDPYKVMDLSWTATFKPPKSWSAKRQAEAIGTQHRQIPDRDNIDKEILDSLFDNDSAIAVGTIKKFWGLEDRLDIVITLES